MTFLSALSIYFSRRMLVIFALGFASGLPLALTGGSLGAWLKDSGIDLTAIGLTAAVATPYTFKFLWAPLVDGLRVPLLSRLLGRRRGWMLLTQVLLVAALAVMAFADPRDALHYTVIMAVVVATLSATQDIAIDAFRVESVSLEEQGAGATAITFGYRIGMLASGAGALALADLHGWQTTYIIMAGLMAVGIVVTLVAREDARDVDVSPHPSPLPEGEGIMVRLKRFFRDSVIAPFADFMTRPHWGAVLAFVVLYKLGDAFMGVMFNPFLLDIGFEKTQIATIVKLYGLWATIAGAFIGGIAVARLGMFRSLLIFGFVHMLTNLLLVVQAHLGANAPFLTISIISENLTGGMSTTAFIAYLGALCKTHYTATQYALLSSFAAFGRTWLSTPSGALAKEVGWEWFFAIASLMAIPGLLLLVWLEMQQRRADRLRQS